MLKEQNPSCADIYQERIARRYMEHENPVAAGVLIDGLRSKIATAEEEERSLILPTHPTPNNYEKNISVPFHLYCHGV